MSDRAETLGSRGGDGDGRAASDAAYVRSVLDSARVAFVETDGDGVVVEFNREAEHMLGYSPQDLVGREISATLIPERHRAAYRSAVARLTGDGATVGLDRRWELSAVHRDGREVPVEMSLSRIEPTPTTGRAGRPSIQVFMHDITERKLAEQVLLASAAVNAAMARSQTPEQAMGSLLASLGENMGWDVGAYWALEDDVLTCRAGWSAPGVEGAAEFDRLGRGVHLPLDASLPGWAVSRSQPVWLPDFGAQPDFPRAAAARRAGLHAAIGVPVRRQGRIIGVIEFLTTRTWIAQPTTADALATVGNQAGELLGILEDRQTLLASLERLALTDQLTGLPNRRAWEEGLDRELALAAREGHDLVVAVIDLDRFKRYNDAHGHQAGDALLAETADAWRMRLRASDLLARYGGEEFAAVIPSWPLPAAASVIDRLRTAVPAGQTCSAGVAGWNRVESAGELFGRADAALYAAKQAGRDRVVVATPSAPSPPR